MNSAELVSLLACCLWENNLLADINLHIVQDHWLSKKLTFALWCQIMNLNSVSWKRDKKIEKQADQMVELQEQP